MIFFSRQDATIEDTVTKYLIEEQRSIEKKIKSYY
jgi:hypothetical protein